MTREQLEHIIRASGSIADVKHLVVLGSQSILGSHYHLPDELGESVEADIFPLKAPERIDVISGSIGELSTFHSSFGYYAHGLSPEACTLPSGWDKRLVPLENEGTSGVTGLCLDPVDLACAKLVAGREKDINFNTAILFHKLVDDSEIEKRMELLPDEKSKALARRSLMIVRTKLVDYTPPSGRPDH